MVCRKGINGGTYLVVRDDARRRVVDIEIRHILGALFVTNSDLIETRNRYEIAPQLSSYYYILNTI